LRFIKSSISIILLLISYLAFSQEVKFILPYESGTLTSDTRLVDVLFFNNRLYGIGPPGIILEGEIGTHRLDRVGHIDCPPVVLAVAGGKVFILGEKGLYSLGGRRLYTVEGGKALLTTSDDRFLLLIKKTGIDKLPVSSRAIPVNRAALDSPPIGYYLHENVLYVLCRKALYFIDSRSMKTLEILLPGQPIHMEISSFRENHILDLLGTQLLYLSADNTISLVDITAPGSGTAILKSFEHPVISCGFWAGNVFAVVNDSDENTRSTFYLLDKKGRELAAPMFIDYQVCQAFSPAKMRNFLFMAGQFGVFEFFYKNQQNRYSHELPSKHAITGRIRLFDLDSDGESDILTTAVSNLESEQFRWKGIGYLLLKRNKAMQYITHDYRIALNMEKKWRLIRALTFIETAQAMNQLVEPDNNELYLGVRARILKKIKIVLWAKKILKIFVIILGLGICMFFGYGFIRKKLYMGHPTDETLEALSGSLFIHHAIYLLTKMSEAAKCGKGDAYIDKQHYQAKELKKMYKYLKSLKKSFSRVSHSWRKAYRLVYRQIKKIAVKPMGIRCSHVEKTLSALEDFHRNILRMRGSIVRNSLVGAVRTVIPMANEKNVKITQDIHVDEKTFGVFYPERLEAFKNVFVSILQNSLDSFEGFVPYGDPTISISAEEDYNTALVVIADNGRGIDPDHLPYIFEPGFTSKKKKGRGCGLAAVKEVIAPWGTVRVESEPGQGTLTALRFVSVKKKENHHD